MIWFPARLTLCNFCPKGNEILLSSLKPTWFAYKWVMLLLSVRKMLLGISSTEESLNIKHLKSWAVRSKLNAKSFTTIRLLKMHEFSDWHSGNAWKFTLLFISEHCKSDASAPASFIMHFAIHIAHSSIQALKYLKVRINSAKVSVDRTEQTSCWFYAPVHNNEHHKTGTEREIQLILGLIDNTEAGIDKKKLQLLLFNVTEVGAYLQILTINLTFCFVFTCFCYLNETKTICFTFFERLITGKFAKLEQNLSTPLGIYSVIKFTEYLVAGILRIRKRKCKLFQLLFNK